MSNKTFCLIFFIYMNIILEQNDWGKLLVKEEK